MLPSRDAYVLVVDDDPAMRELLSSQMGHLGYACRQAGDVEEAFVAPWADLNIGVGVGVQEAAGAGGNGGSVTVNTGGSITTKGAKAHGIVAQSVGGGGGIAGITDSVEGADADSFAGSAGDACTFSVSIDIPVGQPGGNYTNTTGDISALLAGVTPINGIGASDELTVLHPPTLRKSFADSPSVQPGSTVDLEFTLHGHAGDLFYARGQPGD